MLSRAAGSYRTSGTTLYRQLEVDRTLLVRQTHTHRYPLRTFFVDSCGDQPFIRQHEFEEYEQLTQLSRGAAPADDVNGLMFLVCTRPRHDRCCAKFGSAGVVCAADPLRTAPGSARILAATGLPPILLCCPMVCTTGTSRPTTCRSWFGARMRVKLRCRVSGAFLRIQEPVRSGVLSPQRIG